MRRKRSCGCSGRFRTSMRRARLSTWIYTIAHRVAIDHLGKPAVGAKEPLTAGAGESGEDLLDRLPASSALDPEALLSRGESERLIRDGWRRLPEKYRAAARVRGDRRSRLSDDCRHARRAHRNGQDPDLSWETDVETADCIVRVRNADDEDCEEIQQELAGGDIAARIAPRGDRTRRHVSRLPGRPVLPGSGGRGAAVGACLGAAPGLCARRGRAGVLKRAPRPALIAIALSPTRSPWPGPSQQAARPCGVDVSEPRMVSC